MKKEHAQERRPRSLLQRTGSASDLENGRGLTLIAALAWLVVAGYGIRSAVVHDDGDWQLAYIVFSLALLVAAAASVSVAALATRRSGRPRLRMAGLVISSLGCAASLGAWAIPLWTTVLGVGFAMIAVSSEPHQRRPLALLSAAQLMGVTVMFAGIAAEVGSRDEWGDYPAAGGIALGVAAAITIIALFGLTRTDGREQASPRARASRRSSSEAGALSN
jgi:MFS family permease